MKLLPSVGKDSRKGLRSRLDFLIHAPKRELIKAGAVVAIFAGLSGYFSAQYGVFLDLAETRCMPEYLYLGYPKAEVLQRGDIVSFVVTDKTLLGLFVGQRLAKIIAGVPGDHVVSTEDGVYINGKLIAQRTELTLTKMKNKRIAPVNMDRQLQAGELFVVGTLPMSFDSRYWGVLAAGDVDRMVKAVL